MGELLQKQEAQKEYCKANKLPQFVSLVGTCWNCGKNVYDRISLEEAGSDLITGCPFCLRSFCD
jgi:hypothetical protein